MMVVFRIEMNYMMEPYKPLPIDIYKKKKEKTNNVIHIS